MEAGGGGPAALHCGLFVLGVGVGLLGCLGACAQLLSGRAQQVLGL